MKARLALLRKALRQRSLDGVLITHLPHVRYFSGFSGSAGFLLVQARRAHLVIDFRYREQGAREAVEGVSTFVWEKSAYAELVSSGIVSAGARIGFQESHVTVALLDTLKKELRKTKLERTGQLVRDLTLVKTPSEIASVARAARIASRVYAEILDFVKPGMPEDQVAAEISYRGRLIGSEGDAFDIIVASGPRSALPHGRASARKLRRGELVTLDFGCTVDGLHSDMTRTFAIGEPGAHAREIYGIVLAAEQQGVRAARSGMSNRALDEVCRSVIRDAGYGGQFGHGTGHGLGIDVHEAPGISFKAEECLLQPGMIVTVEPGIYLEGRLGVRIEDDVVITDGGRRVLTSAPRELIVV